MSDQSSITLPEGAGTLRRGDILTFSSRPRWWKRLWRWVSRRPPRPLRQFVVTSVSTSTVYYYLPLPDPHEIARSTGQTIGPDAVVEQHVVQDPVVLIIEGETYGTERVITQVDDWRQWRDLTINFGWVHIGAAMPSGTYGPTQ